MGCRAKGFAVHYVDLEAEPKLDKNNPGDLKPLADSATPYDNLPDAPAEAPQPTTTATAASSSTADVRQ